VKSYRIRNALHSRSGVTYDAHIVPDGRVWGYKGQGETDEIYQVFGRFPPPLTELSEGDLRRIADGLTEIAKQASGS